MPVAQMAAYGVAENGGLAYDRASVQWTSTLVAVIDCQSL
jgi:hypothetical protein